MSGFNASFALAGIGILVLLFCGPLAADYADSAKKAPRALKGVMWGAFALTWPLLARLIIAAVLS